VHGVYHKHMSLLHSALIDAVENQADASAALLRAGPASLLLLHFSAVPQYW
jgi:hypothetical protein